MADDLSGQAAGSMWPTGQGTDMVSDPGRAMTAPGSVPAVPGSTDWTDPGTPAVAAAGPDEADRRTVHGEPGGAAAGRRDDVSGRREPWR